MKGAQQEKIVSCINKLIFSVSKSKRCELQDEIYFLCNVTKQDPGKFFVSRQGQHWKEKKREERFAVFWRSTQDHQILLREDAAKAVKLTPHQVTYRCSKGGGKFHLTMENPETGHDDIATVTKVCVPLNIGL